MRTGLLTSWLLGIACIPVAHECFSFETPVFSLYPQVPISSPAVILLPSTQPNPFKPPLSVASHVRGHLDGLPGPAALPSSARASAVLSRGTFEFHNPCVLSFYLPISLPSRTSKIDRSEVSLLFYLLTQFQNPLIAFLATFLCSGYQLPCTRGARMNLIPAAPRLGGGQGHNLNRSFEHPEVRCVHRALWGHRKGTT